MFFATQIILGATLIGLSSLLFLLLRRPGALIQRLFALYIGSVTVWTLCIFLNLWLHSVLVEKLIFASAAIGLTVPVWFAKLFPDAPLPRHAREYWSVLVGAFFFVISFYDGAVFSSLSAHPEGYTTLASGFVSGYYSLFAFIFSAAPIVLFWRKRRMTDDATLRIQLFYLIIGFALFLCVSTLTNSILPVFFGIYFFNAIGPVFSLCLATAVFYIIWRHQFLDIRLIIQRGLVYSIVFALIVGAYWAALLIAGDVLGIATRLAAPLSAAFVMIVGIFTVPPLERFFKRTTDHIFFKDTYVYSLALQELSDILNTHNTPKPLIDKTLAALRRILRVGRAEFYFQGDTPAEGALVIPIASKQKKLGTLVLGDKLSGDPYTPEDRDLLRTLASEFAIALQKAELFGRVRQHSRELEKKVAERTEHLEALREHQRQMTSDISHEFQTPLTIIRSALERLEEERGHAEQKKSVRSMKESVDRLSRLMYDLLRLSELETIPEVRHAPFSLSAAMDHVAEYVETICTEHRITLVRDIEPDISFSGDEPQLEELATNLLANAVRYMGDSKKRQITIALKRTEHAVELSVADTGVGIPAEALPHIFERFYRAQGNTALGSGLGLAICKRIAELHGGEITAQSDEGRGTTFTARLPAVS